MSREQAGQPAQVGIATTERRGADRIHGPFDAWRTGVIDTPVRVYDIGLGGCFVNAMHEQEHGVVVTLKVELPPEGWLELKAKTLYRRPGFGFAVRFIDMDEETRGRLERALAARRAKDRP